MKESDEKKSSVPTEIKSENASSVRKQTCTVISMRTPEEKKKKIDEWHKRIDHLYRNEEEGIVAKRCECKCCKICHPPGFFNRLWQKIKAKLCDCSGPKC